VVGLYFTLSLSELILILRIVPLGMLLTLIPLILWRFLPPRIPFDFTSRQKVTFMMTVSLLLWLILAFITSYYLEESMIITDTFEIVSYSSICFYFIIAALFAFIPDLFIGRVGEEPIHLIHHIIRFSLGAATTVLGILLSSWNGDIGALALSFPAVVYTSLCTLWVLQGEAVSTSAVSPLLLGSTTNSLFAILFGIALPVIQNEIGALPGFILCLLAVWFLCVYAFSLPMVYFLRKKEIGSSQYVGKIFWDETKEENNPSDEGEPLKNNDSK